MTPPPQPAPPTFAEAVRFWLWLGCVSFGGPAGQIALMHQEVVERRGWVDEERFLHGLNFCLLLPGPEAQQLAIYLGWRLHRVRGGVAAGLLFVLPSALLLWGLSWLYAAWGSVPAVAAVFYGLKPAVLAIVAAAAWRLGGRALGTWGKRAVAALAFGALAGGVPFPAVVAGALGIGWFGARIWPGQFEAARQGEGAPAASEVIDPVATSWGRAGRTAAAWGALWWTPILLAGAWGGWHGTLFRQGVFFAKAAAVTFGGAYAVLPYVSQQAVETYRWLLPGQMLDGLGLAETTPGPLIMVLQFVGFLGGWNHPGALPRLLAATLGAALTTWATFAPCFLWVFLGAPHLERLRRQPRLGAALGAVGAAVAGVVLHLAVWFAAQVLWPKGGLDGFAAALAVAAFAAMRRFKAGAGPVIAGCAAAGVVWQLLIFG